VRWDECWSPAWQAAAWLHDVLEHTGATAADLAAEGVPADVVRLVEILSRRPGEDYLDFIGRVCADPAAVRLGTLPEIRGADAVAQLYKGRAQAARTALVDGEIGVAVILSGHLRIALRITFSGDRIAGIEALADAERIAALEVEVLER